jgi:hypothetical protein
VEGHARANHPGPDHDHVGHSYSACGVELLNWP